MKDPEDDKTVDWVEGEDIYGLIDELVEELYGDEHD